MQHHVIVKFNDLVKDKSAFADKVGKMFKGMEGTVEGVHSVTYHKNCINMPNRFDLMIIVDMDKDALESYSNSPIHVDWIDNYAKYLEAKTIMDYED